MPSVPDDPSPRPARARVTGMSRGERLLRLLLLVALLYLFLLAVDTLGNGIAGFGEGFTDQLFRGIGNPAVGLLVGVLATVLAQSSSVTTATLVGLVASGVVGVDEAVPVIMGANVGTTITNTLASLGSIRRTEEFRRAFTGATMHDVFNLASIVILLPVELLTGLLSRTAVFLSDFVGDAQTGEFESPVRAVVAGVGEQIEAGVNALAPGDLVAAGTLLVLGLGLIFGTLYSITRNMRVVMAGTAERWLNAVLGRAGTLAILIGIVLTVAVQSSSIATALLIPMIAAGVLRLDHAYPVTLGANLGTTVSALLAALAVPGIAGLQIALVHLAFNVVGLLLFWPIPPLRRIPLRAARWMGDQAVKRRSTVLAYVILLFYVVPFVGILVLR
ncbi:Na/Pi symporter [Egibacter rhizosphaerae]|uniref:Na/Pi symporter n=1 Tax=Egibacter rhizosphaerae TaxID=1670831 RepID=UPI0013F1507D|nr:Na/Pi symporter [Egibacter rhizosphaerae]